MRVTLCWGPYNKDPTILGAISGSPIFGNSHIGGVQKYHPTEIPLNLFTESLTP